MNVRCIHNRNDVQFKFSSDSLAIILFIIFYNYVFRLDFLSVMGVHVSDAREVVITYSYS